ncbi:MAG: porin family protein [Elusimicrobiaceae bacterium]|nr:porin family protein [Elusimicrobiaceae bacterium]
MRKAIFSCAVLFLCLPAFAQLEQGQHMLGGRLGLGFQLENSGISYSDSDRIDWGTLGVEYGLSYYYLLTEHIGLGADISYGDFEGGELFNSSEDVDDTTRLFNAMLSARLTANPSSKFRWYIPVGLGITSVQQDIHVDKHGIKYDKKATDTSLVWFVGAGLEFDLGSNGWSMGLEARYYTFHYDTDKLIRHAPPAITGDGNRRLSYLLFQLLVSKRF